jgi:hypothetical protein
MGTDLDRKKIDAVGTFVTLSLLSLLVFSFVFIFTESSKKSTSPTGFAISTKPSAVSPLEGNYNPLLDADQDGYMRMPSGGDCNDDNPSIHPGAKEVCDNQQDDNCDGRVDCLDPECCKTAHCSGINASNGACPFG